MSSNQLKDPSALVEEGVIVADDTKSDAGSATTAPSIDSGAAPPDNNNKEAAPSSRRRCRLIGGGVALVVIAGIIVAAVVAGTCDKDKNKNSTTAVSTQEDSISLGGDEEAPPMFPHDATTPVEDLPKPFGDIELPLFEQDVLDQYPSRDALEQDLTLAAKDMVNKVIRQNLEYAQTYHMTHPHSGEVVMGLEDIAVEAALGASTASAAAKQSAQQKVQESLKMTNNQEQDVDEADVLKTDGNHVYAAYGDYLVVWDLQGNLVTQEKMPVPQEESNPDLPQEAEDEEEFIRDPFFTSMTYAYIESLQLTADHVIAIVGGMGEFQEDSVVYGAKGSHVRVYTKPTANRPTLELVATRDVHGYFFNSRYLADSNTIHIVTGGDFSTFGELIEPLDVYHFEGLNQTEYYYAARLLAEKELIPRFVGRVTDFFVNGNDGQLPTMLKVNQWRTQAQQDAVKDDDRKVHPEEHFYGSYDEAFRAYIQVTSFPADDLPTTPIDTPLPVTTTALVGPSSWGFMYATDDSIVLHMSRHDWNPETDHAEETLFLMHLKVNDGGSTQFHSVATLPGYLPGTRAMDIQGDDLRVATTHQKWMPLENVWPVCGDSWYFEDECMNEENWNDCFDVALDCREVAKTGCPYTFECQDDPEEVRDESSTDNTVFVLDLSQPGLMKQHGSVRIGEPHEVIMGVHFGETFSYANTFDQRDPFYVLNLPAGGAPTIAGELKLEGFSSYLQPLNEDATLLVGIGQNVSGQGMDQAPNGLLVTVFDVSNPNTPKALASDMLVDPAKADSYSDAEWDAKSVQYRDGILVIPLSVYQKHNGGDGEWIEDWETQVVSSNGVVPPEEEAAEEDPSLNFEGFIVLDVSDVAGQGIQEVARINHSQKQGENCHYCSGYLSYRRSFLFEDKSLMTVHDSAVVSTDVTSGNKIWSFNVTMPGEDMNCCY